MLPILSLKDNRLKEYRKTHGFVYRTNKGLRVYTFDNRPAGKPIKAIKLNVNGLTISEAVIMSNKLLANR